MRLLIVMPLLALRGALPPAPPAAAAVALPMPAPSALAPSTETRAASPNLPSAKVDPPAAEEPGPEEEEGCG